MGFYPVRVWIYLFLTELLYFQKLPMYLLYDHLRLKKLFISFTKGTIRTFSAFLPVGKLVPLRICMLSLIFIIPQIINGQRVGLVLSGGGAKGIAHIGVIQALEENGIPIDYITGTSIGAVVGSLYAMGYSPAEMLELIKSEEFMDAQTGKISNRFIYFFKKPDPTPEFVNFKLGLRDSTINLQQLLPHSLINPAPMNFSFLRLYSEANAQCGGDFNQLFIPFRCVASDVYNKKELVLSKGDLGMAVRASMTFPFVFFPVKMNEVMVYDGGIYNNFPSDVMERDFGPDIIIGSIVSDNPKKPEEADLMGQIENMVMQKTDYTVSPERGEVIRFKFKGIGLLDFNKADQLFTIGYGKGLEFVEKLKGRISRQMDPEVLAMQRLEYKSQLPALVFDSVEVSGGSSLQNEYIAHHIRNKDEQVMDIEAFKVNYYRLLSDENISALNPISKYNPATGLYKLYLHAEMEKNITAALGGFITSMNANSIYLGTDFQVLQQNSFHFKFSGQLGQNYSGLWGSCRVDLNKKHPMYLKLLYVLHDTKYYESDKLFTTRDLPCFIRQSESYVKLRIGLPIRQKAKMIISGGYGYLFDRYYQSNGVDFRERSQDESWYKLVRGALLMEQNTLDYRMYPTTGAQCQITGCYVYGNRYYRPGNKEGEGRQPIQSSKTSWLQAEVRYERYFPISRYFVLGARGQGVISTKGLSQNYTETMLQAPGFTPTPHSQTFFNPAFHSLQYLAGGVIPIVQLSNKLNLRAEGYFFLPIRSIKNSPSGVPYYGKDFSKGVWMAESTLVYNLNFASIGVFVNRYSAPHNSWNFGLNIGFLIRSPKFI